MLKKSDKDNKNGKMTQDAGLKAKEGSAKA